MTSKYIKRMLVRIRRSLLVDGWVDILMEPDGSPATNYGALVMTYAAKGCLVSGEIVHEEFDDTYWRRYKVVAKGK